MSLMKGLFDRKASNQPFNPSDDIPRSTTQEAIQYAANGGGGSGAPAAPDDAQYLVSSSNGDLTNERVISNGLGITWDFSGIGSGIANLDFMGLQDLTAPGADRGVFYDQSEGAFKFFEPTIGLGFSAGELSITDPDLVYIINTTFSDGDILFHNGTTLQRLAAGVDGQFLRTRGPGNDPDWQNISGGGDMLRANNLSDLTDFTAARENIGLGETDSPEFTDLLLTGSGTISGNLEVSGYGFFGGGAMGTQFAAPGVHLGIDTNGDAKLHIASTGTYGYLDIGGTDEDYKARLLVEIANGNTTLDVLGTLAFTTGGAVSFDHDVSVPDEAYDATAWNGVLEVPTKNAVRDKFELVLGTTLPATYQPLDADLTQIAAFSGTGFAARTASNTWAQRELTAPAAGLSITNPAGIAGNPTFALANDLAALEGLSSTGIAVRTGTDAWAQRTITGTSNEITVSNGSGASGNPTLSLPSALTFSGKTVTGGTFASPAAITGLPDPTNAQDAATKAYVDTVAQGLDAKVSVAAATTANITLSGAQTIDGVSVTAGQRVLVKNQDTASQNGIYVVAAGSWSRSADLDNWSEVPGAFVFVENGGTANGNTGWVCTSSAGGTIDSTSMAWMQFSGAGTYTAGTGLQLVGTQFSISDAELLALAGLTSAADALPYFTGSGSASTTTLTSFMRGLLDDSDAATARATLGLTIGTHVQAYDALLASIAGLTFGSDNFIYGTGSDTAAVGTITSVGRTLVSQSSQENMRTTGLGMSANGSSLVTAANYAAMRGLLDLEAGTDFNAYSDRLADVAGISWTQGDIMYFNGTNLVRLAPGTNGQYLASGGPAANLSWVDAAGSGTVTDITAGVGLTTGGSPINVSGTISLDFGIVEPGAASAGSNQITLDVDNGAELFFTRTMAYNETVLEPVDMPTGSTISLLIDPTQHPTTAPVVAARSQGASAAADTNTHAITLPSGITAGDLLLVVFSVDAAPTVSVNTGVSGDNWQKLGQASNGSNATGAIFWKVAEGSDALTLTTTSNEQSTHICFRITGTTPSNPDIGGTSANGSSTNGDPPLHTPSRTQNYLSIVSLSTDAQVVATVAPSGYGNLTTQAAASANGASTSVADNTLSSASSENPGVFTNTTEQWACWTILIGPYGIYVPSWHSSFKAPLPDISAESLIQIQKIDSSRYVAVKAWEKE